MSHHPQDASPASAGLPTAGEDASAGRRRSAWRWGQASWARRSAMVVASVVGALALLAGLVWVAPPALAARVIEPFLRAYAGFPTLPDELERPAERSVIYDADGEELATLYRDEHRVSVGIEEMPDELRQAVLAIEDHHFPDHPGIDHRAILRAALANWRADTVVEGGSTITQQLVKNALVGDEQTLRRKATEASLAIRLERRLSKDEILERYLNQAYLGEGAYGVGTAAELYFSKSVDELDLPESAILAGLLAAPEATNPIDEPEAARQRRDVVLAQMAERGYLDESEADAAAEQPVETQVTRPEPPDEPFFVAAVVEELLASERLADTEEARREALYTGGLRIRTTLDRAQQSEANEAIAGILENPESDPQASVVAVEPGDGAVTALAVGPREWGDCEDAEDDAEACPRTRVNPAVPGLGGSGRQLGSAFKPFAVAAALEAGVGPGWEFTAESEEEIPGCDDVEEEGDWTPRNFDDVDAGVIDMDEAVATSNNVYHAKLGALLGPEAMAEAAARGGLTTGGLEGHCALALGAGSVYPLRVATAYATFAAGGERCEPYFVSEVAFPDGEELTRQPSCEEAFEREVADTVTGLLEGVVEDGTGSGAAIDGVSLAGKTGTTQDSRDAWFAGFTGGEEPLAAAVWIGHEEPAPLEDVAGEDVVTGSSLPADMFSAFMEAAVEGRDTGGFDDADQDGEVDATDVTGRDIGEVLGDAREIPSAGDPSERLRDDLDPTDEDPEHYAIGRFDLHIVVYEVSDWRPAGEIVWQSEDGGTVTAGSLLVLAVSDGEGSRPEPPDDDGDEDSDDDDEGDDDEGDDDEGDDEGDDGEGDDGDGDDEGDDGGDGDDGDGGGGDDDGGGDDGDGDDGDGDGGGDDGDGDGDDGDGDGGGDDDGSDDGSDGDDSGSGDEESEDSATTEDMPSAETATARP